MTSSEIVGRIEAICRLHGANMVSRDSGRRLTVDERLEAHRYPFRSARARREGCSGGAPQNRTPEGRANAGAAGSRSGRARLTSAIRTAEPARLQIHAATFLPECGCAFPGPVPRAGMEPAPSPRGRYNPGIAPTHRNHTARSLPATTGRMNRSRPGKCRTWLLATLCCLPNTPLL